MIYDEAHRAIKRGRIDLLTEALASGLNPNEANQHGWTLLMLAALEGNVPVGRLLLVHGANPAPRNKIGDTAASLAELKGHTRFAELMRDQGGAN